MGGSGSALRGKTKRLSSINSMSELQSYASGHGIIFKGDTSSLDVGTMKDAIAQVERLQSELPFLAQQDVTISVDQLSNNAYGSALPTYNFNGADIKVNSKYFTTDNVEYGRTRFATDVNTGFHPKGTTLSNVIAHEYGHYIESQLIQMTYIGRSAKVDAWNKSTMATKIVHSASVKVKKTDYGKGKSIDQLVNSISRYGLKSRSEALAEAIADYARNGSNANPMSKAIWNEVKSYVNN